MGAQPRMPGTKLQISRQSQRFCTEMWLEYSEICLSSGFSKWTDSQQNQCFAPLLNRLPWASIQFSESEDPINPVCRILGQLLAATCVLSHVTAKQSGQKFPRAWLPQSARPLPT